MPILVYAIVALSFFLYTDAFASDVWKVAKIDRETRASFIQKKIDLPTDTQVDHPLFSVLIPKGWSCSQRSDSLVEVLTCTPTSNLVADNTYIAINRRYGATVHTIDSNFDQFKKNSKRMTIKKNLNGGEWVYSTLEIEQKLKMKQWTLTSIKNKTEFIVLASVPITDLNKYENQIEKIFGSISLK